jgi:hypothetical protein
MRLVCNSVIRSALRALAVVAAATVAPVAVAVAQADQAAALPSLQSIDQAQRSQDYTAIQVRRFVTPATPGAPASVTSVRERLEVAANGSAKPTFALTFLGVEGEPAGSPLQLKWQQTYARHGAQFFAHGSFRVRDLQVASANYTTHDFGPVTRAGRTARRLVVFPTSVDKSIWLVEIDDATAVSLYAAEFDSHLNLLAEVEAVSFTDAVGTFTPQASTAAAVTDFVAGKSAMGDPVGLVEPILAATSEYSLDRVEVQNDPLNGSWKMTLTYTDGVDQFVVVQSPGTPDAFAALPGKANGGAVIGRFRDAAMSALVFWEGGVSFQVAGRGSLRRLDDLAKSVYLQALSSN